MKVDTIVVLSIIFPIEILNNFTLLLNILLIFNESLREIDAKRFLRIFNIPYSSSTSTYHHVKEMFCVSLSQCLSVSSPCPLLSTRESLTDEHPSITPPTSPIATPSSFTKDSVVERRYHHCWPTSFRGNNSFSIFVDLPSQLDSVRFLYRFSLSHFRRDGTVRE